MIAAMLACAGPARADEPSTPDAASTTSSDAPTAVTSTPEAGAPTDTAAPETRPPDRPLPDYDGLPEPGDDGGDVLLWTARVLTSPLYLVSEYVLRQPIVAAMTEMERHRMIEQAREFFTFGPDDTITLFPTFFYELGFQPGFGVYGAWDRFLFPENRITTSAGFGGIDWLSWTLTDRIEIDERWEVGARSLLRKRPDYVFGGIGPDATDLPRARFAADRFEPVLWSAVRYWQSSDIEFDLRYRSIGFIDRGWNGDPSVAQRARDFGQALPYGYETGYEAVSGEMYVDVDTRTPYAPPEGGIRIAGHAGLHAGFGGLPKLERWVSWGGTATFAADVLGGHRVLGVTADAHFISPLSDSNVPFTELVELGGANGLLPGYRPGHIQGLSAVGLTAHYGWPIWAFLDARLYFGTANAFGRHLEDFDVEKLRLTFGLEIVPRVPDIDLPFHFNFAFATDTFDDGTTLESFRFAIGAREVL